MPFIQLQFRRDTSQQWACTNPILASGELGLEMDTHMFKIGDGCSPWVNLPYGGIQGPRGPQGPAGSGSGGGGATGPQGVQGPQGPSGSNGSNGSNGSPGQGVPTGGTTGQVLAKIDGTNYNTQWITPSSGGSGGAGPYYVELTYPTSAGVFDGGTYPTVATSHLPPSYNVSIVSNSIHISNSQVTNSNSWQLTLGPIYVQYASGSSDISTWLTNQTWNYWSPPAGVVANTAGVITIPDSSFGTIAGNNSFSGNGDTNSYVFARIVIMPFFFN